MSNNSISDFKYTFENLDIIFYVIKKRLTENKPSEALKYMIVIETFLNHLRKDMIA